MKMKKKPLLSVLILALSLFQSAKADEDAEFLGLLDPLRAGEPAPAITFLNTQGQTRTLADYAGEALVVNFWATWCAPCIAEMPALDRLNQRFLAAGVKARVLTINTDFSPEVGPQWLAANGIQTLGAYYDHTGNAFFDAGGQGMPHTLIIAPAGTLAFDIFGDAPWDSDAAFERVADLYL